jgi:peptidoglycan/LPS O-acetylase OafA/YrhL
LIKTTKKLDYIPGLDGIRALAALLVISTHWPNSSISLKFGWVGVNIFFVLSGFLITRILLNEKKRAFKQYLSNFFYKRALRIFPVYYLFIFTTTLIVLLIYYFAPALSKDQSLTAGLNAIRHDLPFYLTYTYNIKLNLAPLFHFGDYSNDFFGHLWSLAVEEQFYIIFPFLVYFLDATQLKKLVIAIIIIFPLIRLWAAVIGTHLVSDKYWLGELLYTNTFCQADALAAGALLALHPIKIKFPYLKFFMVSFICLGVGLTCFYFLRQAGYFLVQGSSLGFDFPGYWFMETTPHFLINIRAFYQYSLVNLFAFFLIAPAVIKKPLFPVLLQSRPVIYLGKISYGVYLFHNPIKALFVMGGNFFGGWFKLTANPFIHISIFIFYLFVVIMLAHLSYQYFERKITMKYNPTNAAS